MKFGDAKVIPIKSADSKCADASEQRSRVLSEYEEQAEMMRYDITSFVYEGRNIRDEVERLITWRRDMGEGTASPNWGLTQQNYAANWIEYQRARLAKLKSAIEADSKNVSEIIEHIFGERYPSRYGSEVTKQARLQLGI